MTCNHWIKPSLQLARNSLWFSASTRVLCEQALGFCASIRVSCKQLICRPHALLHTHGGGGSRRSGGGSRKATDVPAVAGPDQLWPANGLHSLVNSGGTVHHCTGVAASQLHGMHHVLRSSMGCITYTGVAASQLHGTHHIHCADRRMVVHSRQLPSASHFHAHEADTCSTAARCTRRFWRTWCTRWRLWASGSGTDRTAPGYLRYPPSLPPPLPSSPRDSPLPCGFWFAEPFPLLPCIHLVSKLLRVLDALTKLGSVCVFGADYSYLHELNLRLWKT